MTKAKPEYKTSASKVQGPADLTVLTKSIERTGRDYGQGAIFVPVRDKDGKIIKWWFDGYIDDTDKPRKAKTTKEGFEFLDRAAVFNLPAPVFLIDGLIQEGSNNLLYGEDGSAKTFIALDMALSIGNGLPWFGHKVTQGDVVYVYTEGQAGLPERLDAWEKEHGLKYDRVLFLPIPVHISIPARVKAFIEAIRDKGYFPQFIVIDTLATNKGPGIDVNKDVDMDYYHTGTRALRDEFPGCATLTVHHTGKDARRGSKGSTSIEDPMDAIFEAIKEKSAKQGQLKNHKQRDGELHELIYFRVKPVEGTKGAVVVPDGSKGMPGTLGDIETDDEPAPKRKPAKSQVAIMKALSGFPSGLTATELVRKSKLNRSTLYDRLPKMVDAQLIEKNEKTSRWQVRNRSTKPDLKN